VKTTDGRQRVVIEKVSPEIDGGRFPIKRIVGEEVRVEADIFADGHEVVRAILSYRATPGDWFETRMEAESNDRWQAVFFPSSAGVFQYTIQAWVDPFQSWQRDIEKKFKAGAELRLELVAGADLLLAAADRAPQEDGGYLNEIARALSAQNGLPVSARVSLALSARVADLMGRYGERRHPVRYARNLEVVVDPALAGFSAWYEMFPRSASSEPGKHGTFADCERLLPYVAKMGFDVLYLPPIHPIGRSFRKGKNNRLACAPEDPGSPWAIGNEEGGHKAVDPQLGTLTDFRHLVRQAGELGIKVALDIALQCSPDHSYVREHPEWFRHRPDGTIQYAENPPKKYQDIYPFDFECEEWEALWRELKSIFEFWIEQGISVFRVDNPHTKPFRFWEWCLTELKAAHPQLIFLSEAFTRPKVMFYLAKLGFTQSYNYFPWRNTKPELTEYLTHLTRAPLRDYFRPSFWPNTPDILTQYLRYGGRAAFMVRLILAATLSSNYGIYGPAFELAENEPREPDSEEYMNSEKYEVRHWERDAPGSMASLIARINAVRRNHPALHDNRTLRFHSIDNEQLIAYSKSDEITGDRILVVASLDPHHTQRGWVTLPLEEWKIGPRAAYQVHELLTEARYLWSGPRNFVELDPEFVPAHIFRLRRYVRTEQDFDYFM
jgi:starch synthase (maltosyl-transferring)